MRSRVREALVATCAALASSPAFAQSGDIQATADVAPVAPLVVTPVNDLGFGTVNAGTVNSVQPSDIGAGRLDVSYEPSFSLMLTFTLPGQLNGPASSSIPITFGPAAASIAEGAVPALPFDPNSPFNFSPVTATGLVAVNIGGTVSPPQSAAGGTYTNVITLTVAYQ